MHYYSLDEAASKLGISVDEFRKRMATEWKTLRRFPDGPTLRFQGRDIDELARRLGRSSDPELQLGDAPSGLTELPAGSVGGKKANETLLLPTGSDDDFVPLSLGDEKKEKSGSDSDVKLEKTAGGSVKPTVGKDEPTEVLEVTDSPRAKSSFEVKHDPPKGTPPKKHTPIASEFELSLANDSDEFDLQLGDDSDEVPLGTTTRKGPRSGDSGINLQDPADSGISLEKESSEFELQLEPDATKAAPALADDSDSEFELTLDDDSGSGPNAALDAGEQKDIFETDFELPPIDDSGSEVKSSGDTDLEQSDFDLEVDSGGEESASEVVALEDEDAEGELHEITDEDVQPVRVVSAAETEWGPLPLVGMIPCVLVMFFVGLMGYELVHSMWGYHTGHKVSGPIVSTIAGMFGKVPE